MPIFGVGTKVDAVGREHCYVGTYDRELHLGNVYDSAGSVTDSISHLTLKKTGTYIQVGVGTINPVDRTDRVVLDITQRGYLQFGTSVSSDYRQGIHWDGVYNYGIYRESGGWNTSRKLTIAWNHGVNFIGSHGGVTSAIPSGFSHSSDNRMKHNEVDISNGIAIVNKLKPKFYIKTALKDPSGNVYSNDHDFTEEEKANQILNRYGTYESGFIAQEVREIPELVHTVTGDEYDASGNATNLGLNYDNITPYLARAIQEINREQQADKGIIASLEAIIIAALENT